MQRFGQYEIQSLIGRGGMGEVFLAHDTRRDRDVALKLLPEALGKDPDYERRFRRESYAAARLTEPHVIPIHDYGEADGRLFIDMRLVDGQSLAALLTQEGALTPERSVELVSQVAEALDAAHRDGLIHRDIKPANILVTASDFVYVADFGIAHTMGQTQSVATANGPAAGTLDYMAPERFTNGTIGPRTDVYSLACVLFECITGAKPYLGGDFPSQVYAHMYLEPRRPSEISPHLSHELDAVVARGMAKDPEDRYASASELAGAARDALRAAPTASVPMPQTVAAPATTGTGSPPANAATAGAPTVDPPERITNAGSMSAGANGAVRVTAASAGSTAYSSRAPDVGPPHTPPVDPDGGREGGSSRKPQSLTTMLVAIIAALVLVATAIIVTVVVRQNSSAGGSSVAAFDPAASGSSPRAIGNAVAQPTVGGTVQVGATPGYMEIAPNGQFAYIANRAAGVLTVFDTARNVPTGLIPVPDGGPQFVAFSPDGSRAYVSIFNQDYSLNEVGVLDTSTGTFIARVPTGKRPFALDVSPDGRKLYVPNHDSGSLTVIDTASNKVVNTIQLAPNPHWVDFSPDGTRLYAANHESNIITTLDTSNDAVLGTVAVGKSPHSIVRHSTRPLVFNANYDDSSVSVTDVNTSRVVATVPTASHPQDITLSADGKYAYVATVDANALQVLDTKSYKVVSKIPTGRGPTSIAVTPDGRQGYVTNLLDGTVTVLNLASTA